MQQKFNHMPTSLQSRTEAYAATTAKKAAAICRRNGITKDTAAAITADAMDVLAGRYKGLHATYAQMQEVAQKTRQGSWERSKQFELEFVAVTYACIVDCVQNGTPTGYRALNPKRIADAPVQCGVKEVKGQQPTQQELADMDYLYYCLCLLIMATECNATEDELKALDAGSIPAAIQRSAIAMALEDKQEKQDKETRPAPQHHAEGTFTFSANDILQTHTNSSRTVVGNPNTPIRQYQHITEALGGELPMAPVRRDGTEAALRPLRKAIAERAAVAEQLRLQAAKDSSITPLDILRAENRITNEESIRYAFDGLHIMLQTEQPNSRTATATGYTITAHRFAQLATGQQNPHQTQVINIMRALDLLSTERMDVVEKVVRNYRTKDKDGKVVVKKKEKVMHTRFTPVNVRFYGEYGGEEVPLTNAYSMDIQVDKMITEGRSTQSIQIQEEDGKKHVYTLPTPRANFLQVQQIYSLNNVVGSRFRNILISKAQVVMTDTILSKAHMAQDKLLAAVFDYGGRLHDAQEKAQAAQEEWERMKEDGTATAEQLQAAQMKAQDAWKNATPQRIASKHKDRDVQTLKGLFKKAQEAGIINSYFVKPKAGATQKANGEWTAYVWEWLRPAKQAPKNN